MGESWGRKFAHGVLQNLVSTLIWGGLLLALPWLLNAPVYLIPVIAVAIIGLVLFSFVQLKRLGWWFPVTSKWGGPHAESNRAQLEWIRTDGAIRRPLFLLGAIGIAFLILVGAGIILYDRQEIAVLEKRQTDRASELGNVIKTSGQSNRQLREETLDLVDTLRMTVAAAMDRDNLLRRVASHLSVTYAHAPFTAVEVDRYEGKMKIRAELFRLALLARLKKPDELLPVYRSPMSIESLRAIADDLERLARELPDA